MAGERGSLYDSVKRNLSRPDAPLAPIDLNERVETLRRAGARRSSAILEVNGHEADGGASMGNEAIRRAHSFLAYLPTPVRAHQDDVILCVARGSEPLHVQLGRGFSLPALPPVPLENVNHRGKEARNITWLRDANVDWLRSVHLAAEYEAWRRHCHDAHLNQ